MIACSPGSLVPGANVSETHSKKAPDVSNSSSAVHVFVVYKMWQDSCFINYCARVGIDYTTTFFILPNKTGHKRKVVACVRGHSFLFHEKMFPFGVKENPRDHI